MKLLEELTRNLVLILLLATFLELLLPKSDLSRYIRLVVGLFVILTILHPVLPLFELQGSVVLPNKDLSEEQLQGILDTANQLQEQQQEKAMQATLERLERQVEAMVYLVHGIDSARVKLTLGIKPETGLEVMHAVITIIPEEAVTSTSQDIQEVTKVAIGTEQVQPAIPVSESEREQGKAVQILMEKVANGVSAYLGLEPEKIQVIIAAS